jgi:hypothetical protein
MESVNLSRRSLLQAIAAIIAGSATPLGRAEVAHAMDAVHAAHAAAPGADPKLTFFNAADAADVEAVTAQIIPSDDSPGAREAGVVYFIDRALTSIYAQLAAFQSAFRASRPDAVSFASLTSAQQIEYLKQVDETPFFNTTRLLTLLGMFSLPAYRGNRDGVGWKLIGFEDAHVFQPPFGYYDRDYPGFVIDR